MEAHLSPLHEAEVALGAKFSVFGGWLMPLEYSSVLAEHAAVRERVGVFDVSHLGKLRVSGPGAADYLNTRLANDLGRIAAGQAQYTLLCNERGGVIDDLIAYRFADDDVHLIPNAANAATVAAHLSAGAPAGIAIVNDHFDYVVLAVQGPSSTAVLDAMGLPTGMDYMAFARADFGGHPLTVCRTGYTGELGYELVAPNDAATALWESILAAGAAHGIMACGLGARDTLRTEMGYPLHGQDISPDISPVQAGLNWAVGWGKPTFDGADVLRAERAAAPARRLRGLKAVGRGIPRPGMPVLDADGDPVGEVTSGTFSPTLKVGIALALVPGTVALGDVVGVGIRGRTEPFEVVKPPFVASGVR